MALWLAHLEFELGDPGSIPGRATIPLGIAILGKLFTFIASPVSQLQETGGTKREFSAPK